NASKLDDRIDKLADQISTLVDIFAKKVVTPATTKAVEESCVTCGGNHAYYNCDATNNNQSSVCATTGTYNQVAPQNSASNYMAPLGFAPVKNNSQNRFNQNQGQGNIFNRGNNFYGNQSFQVPNQGSQNQPFQVPNNQVQQGFSNEFLNYKKANDQMIRNKQSQINSLKEEFKNEIQNTMKTQQTVLMKQQNAFQNMLSGFFQNHASTSGTLPSNTIPNPKGIEETTDKEQTNFQGSTARIQPPVVPIPEPDVPKTLRKPNIPYPSRLNDQKLHKKATNQMEKFFQIFQDLHFDISFKDDLLLMPKFASTIKSLLANKDKLFELDKIPLNENCLAMLLKKLPKKLGDPGKFLIPCEFLGMDVCHALADLGASINLMPLSIWKKLSLPELTPTHMTLELVDRSITCPKGVVKDIFVKVGKFHFLTDFVVVDFEADPRTTRYSSTYDDMSVNRIDVTDVAREEYAQEMLGFYDNFLGGNPTSTFELIISDSSPSLTPFKRSDLILEEIEAYLKDEQISSGIDHADCNPKGDIYLKVDEKQVLLKVLKSHKRAIACKITNIKGIDPHFCTHKILMEEDYKLAVQSQRWVNPKIHEVIKKEVIKLLDAGMIYPISDSPWVSPIHCVPKKGGITVVENENNELIPTRLVTGWRICIDYRKLNDATHKDHFPLPFMDQIRSSGTPHFREILLRTGRALIDVYGEEITLHVNDEAVTFNLNQTTRYYSTYDDMSVNRIDVIDVAIEEYA
nr:reverse transcriptase domain-containing protein [Tanacetum cinerariifolium]